MSVRTIKRICLLYNPHSGSGRAMALKDQFQGALQEAGYQLKVVRAGTGQAAITADTLSGVDCVVLFGGDGTLRFHLNALCQSGAAVYMVPVGNESLFAQEFSMSTSSQMLLKVLKRGEVERRYVASVNGEPFFTMLSAGFDSEVVQAVSDRRVGTVSNWSYFVEVCRLLRLHEAPLLSIKVDGKTVCKNEQGYVIVANSPKYALGLALVPEADSKKEALHGRFVPYRSALQFLLFALGVFLRRGVGGREVLTFSGDCIELATGFAKNSNSFPYQVDGDSLGAQELVVQGAYHTLGVLTAGNL